MSYSDNKAHQANIISAEAQKQIAYAAATGTAAMIAASVKAADIAYHRSLRASAIANGCSPVSDSNALRELGTTGS
jgi:hypothetical protein